VIFNTRFEKKMSYVFCQYCGARNESTNNFCENCGQTLSQPQPQSQSQPQTSNTYQSYQPSQSNASQPIRQSSSTAGSFDALPGRAYPYSPQKREGMPTVAKVLLIIFFFVIPLIFFILFFGIFNWFRF
jgi:uncharacterized membrane protein YvbJ